MAIADTQLIFRIDHIDGCLNRVGKIRLLDDTITAEHLDGDLLQLIGRHHALTPGILSDHHGAENRLQHTEILLDLLVSHHGDHTDQLLEVVAFLDGLTQGFGGVDIMAAVQNDGRRGTNLLDAARNLHRAQCFGHQIAIQWAVDRNHHFGGGERGERVMRLMLAELGNRHALIRAIGRGESGHLAADRGHAIGHGHLVTVTHHSGMVAFGGLLKNRHDRFLVRLTPDDGGAVRLDDAGLLACDLLDGVPQPLHVVHVDRADDRGIRVQHIGGVPQAAHADLDNGHVHGSVGEFPDGHGGEHFEEAHLRLALFLHFGVHQGHEVLGLVPYVDEIVIGKLLAVDGDTLVDLLQMRRGVQAGTHAVRTADGFGHARGGALAVGAGHMDHTERLLRVAQNIEHQIHPVKIQIGGVVLRRTAHDIQFDVPHALVVPIRMLE